MTAAADSLKVLNAEIVACNRCPRLRAHCAEIARVKRRAFADWEYWGKPVPSFGDQRARVMVLGLAPGAHGSNRTGRPFTGDGSGDFLYPVLHEARFASQSRALSRDDGMRLNDLWICSVVRCAPWLDREMELLCNLRVVVCLGRIAFEGLLAHLRRREERTETPGLRTALRFAHGAEYKLPGGLTAIASYHPSLQNTNTGKLTRPMLLSVFRRARELAEAGSPKGAGRRG